MSLEKSILNTIQAGREITFDSRSSGGVKVSVKDYAGTIDTYTEQSVIMTNSDFVTDNVLATTIDNLNKKFKK